MNKKLTAILLSALTLGAFSANAQTPAPAAAPTGSWTFTPAVASQYMFRGVRLGGPALQPSIEYGYGSLAVGLWASTPLKDKVVGQSDPELDFYGSYTVVLQPDVLTLVPGVTIYEYPNAKTSNGFYKTTFEPSIALNYTVGGVTLTPKLYYDTVLKGPTAEINAFYAVPLKDVGTELDFNATFGTYKWDAYAENTSPDIKNWGDYWLVGLTVPFAITKSTTLKVGWAYTKGSGNYLKQGTGPRAENTAAVGRGVATISCVFKF